MAPQITMVKKRLLDGSPCKKCGQAEELLRNRGHWQRIDRVMWADEGDPSSEGMRLAAEHGVELAPFFVVEHDDGRPTQVYTSAIKFMKEQLGPGEPVALAEPAADEAPGEASRRFRGAPPQEVLRYALSRFGERCAISFSGAEDVVLIDMASKLGLPFSVFSLDTGRLHSETYRFIERVRTHYGVEIALVSPDAARVEPLVRTKGLFSFYEDGHTECCGVRKVEPLRRTLASFDAWVTGQRQDQSVTRSDLPLVQDDSSSGRQRTKFNPLAEWSLARTWQYLRENDVPYNPLHDQGFISIGCEPCTRAVRPGEHERAGRWWWEAETQRECGLHVK